MVETDTPRGELPLRTPLAPEPDEAFDRVAALIRRVLDVPVGLVSLVDRDRQVFPGQSGLPAPWSETRQTPLTHSFCQYVVRTAEPLIVADARLHPQLRTNLAIDDLGVIAYAGIPLIDLDGSVAGSLCAIDTEPHDWTDAELENLRDLAATCSAELQLRSAARLAQTAVARTSTLLDLSEALSSRLTTADISEAISRLATDRLGAAFGGITVLDPLHQTLTYAEPGVVPIPAKDYLSFPVSRHTPSAQAVLDGRDFFFEDVAQMREAFPQAADVLENSGGGAAVYLPLAAADRVRGSLGIVWGEPRAFTTEDRALLSGLARYTAQAMERALLLADRREVAETLQSVMLPSLPTPDWVELAGRYYPARISDAVGGDWFDVFEMAPDRIGLSIGDVEGHDTQAAAVMGQVRSMLRGLTLTSSGLPSDTLSALDTVLSTVPLGRYATTVVCTLVRDTHMGTDAATLAWSNAGHPTPLLIAPGAPATFLDRRPSRPVGLTLPPPPRDTHVDAIPAGSTLLFFTDGLIERRHVDLEDSLQTMAVSAARHRDLSLTAMVDAVIADLLGDAHEDDVILFGVRLR
jgi:GAF domain-containing protein